MEERPPSSCCNHSSATPKSPAPLTCAAGASLFRLITWRFLFSCQFAKGTAQLTLPPSFRPATSGRGTHRRAAVENPRLRHAQPLFRAVRPPALPLSASVFCSVHDSKPGSKPATARGLGRLTAGRQKKRRHGREDRLPVRRRARVAHFPGEPGLQEREHRLFFRGVDVLDVGCWMVVSSVRLFLRPRPPPPVAPTVFVYFPCLGCPSGFKAPPLPPRSRQIS